MKTEKLEKELDYIIELYRFNKKHFSFTGDAYQTERISKFSNKLEDLLERKSELSKYYELSLKFEDNERRPLNYLIFMTN